MPDRRLRRKEDWMHTHEFNGYGSDVPYLYYKTHDGVVDGIGRMHVNLYGKCDICGEEVLLAKIHCTEEGKLYKKEGK